MGSRVVRKQPTRGARCQAAAARTGNEAVARPKPETGAAFVMADERGWVQGMFMQLFQDKGSARINPAAALVSVDWLQRFSVRRPLQSARAAIGLRQVLTEQRG